MVRWSLWYAAALMSTVHYLEIVTNELDATCSFYEALWGLSFSDEIAELGKARTVKRPDGTLVGVRKPLADHDAPIVRAYLAVEDIAAAAKHAEGQGAVVAYPPTKQGEFGTFCIVILDGVQQGFWQA